MILTTSHLIGIVATLVVITGVGIYAGSKVKSAADFSVGGRKAGSGVVAGTIMGTLVGGASTIGTAQLAFQFGLSAWWFCLGAGIACGVLGIGLVRRLHESSVETIPQYLTRTYGSSAGPISSIFSSIGIFFNIIAQLLAFVAILTSMFAIGPLPAACIGVLLVLAYVMFGGLWGTGLVGVVKLLLLYLCAIACGWVAYSMVGGASGLAAKFPFHPWFSLFGRGVDKDLAAGFSLLVGVISTQTYIQAVASGRNVGEARKGAFISAIFIPPVGIGSILVGLYMKSAFPEAHSAEVFPMFVMKFLPPWLAGIILATLLIAVIGTWAGLSLGISTMLTKDIYKKFFRKQASDAETLTVQRLMILVVCVVSVVFAQGSAGTLILGWSFLSMGLRGCTVFFPLLGAMFFPRFVSPMAGVAATLLGPLACLLWYTFYPKGLDPLYPGLVVSLLTLVLVSMFTAKTKVANA
jgi:SSS family solute:Na+ symporter